MTHDIYTLKREGPRGRGRLIKIGEMRIEGNVTGIPAGQIETLPVGGFNGHIYFHPKDADHMPEPVRPLPPDSV